MSNASNKPPDHPVSPESPQQAGTAVNPGGAAAAIRPPEAGGDTAGRILAAARAHFLQYGFARCTMDCLAEELRMSKKTLYVHFANKDALVEAVLEAKIRDFKDGILGVIEMPGIGFAERAHRLVTQVVAEMSEVAPVFLRDLERTMPAAYARIQAVRRQILPDVWGRMLAEGMARGHVRSELQAPFLAEMVLLSVEGLLHPAVLDRLHLTPRDVIQRVLSTMFTGVLTPTGRKSYEHRMSA